MRSPIRVQPRFSITFTLPLMVPSLLNIDGLHGGTFDWELQIACPRVKTPERWYKSGIADGPFRGKMQILNRGLTRVAGDLGVDATLIPDVTLQGKDNGFNKIYGKPNFRVSPDDVEKFIRRAIKIGFIEALQEQVPDWKP